MGRYFHITVLAEGIGPINIVILRRRKLESEDFWQTVAEFSHGSGDGAVHGTLQHPERLRG